MQLQATEASRHSRSKVLAESRHSLHKTSAAYGWRVGTRTASYWQRVVTRCFKPRLLHKCLWVHRQASHGNRNFFFLQFPQDPKMARVCVINAGWVGGRKFFQPTPLRGLAATESTSSSTRCSDERIKSCSKLLKEKLHNQKREN